MHKPVIYYQFDEERYYRGHYARAYYEYGRDGFGPVAHTLDELIAQVRFAIVNEFTTPSCYLERADRFFPLRDADNCKRNYEAIRSM
jgi:CDP-glycerol glycerophosphotransferase (TagB/SpsB family)